MAAILYLIVCFLAGLLIKRVSGIITLTLFSEIAAEDMPSAAFPPVWTFDIPFALISGTTLVTTIHYFISYAAHFIFRGVDTDPLTVSNIFLLTVAVIIFILYIIRNYSRLSGSGNIIRIWTLRLRSYFSGGSLFYSAVIWGFALFAVYFIFYSFVVKDQVLFSGYTVFSDFAPHTAVISSFAYGDNFPTGYPHFAGDGIQYHFFFFYLCANLVSLGMRFDFAMNIPTIIGILSFTTLLGSLGTLITRRKAVFLLAPFMLFFRSSMAVFDYLRELAEKPDSSISSVIRDIFATNKFIGTTVHDDWGLWAMNVYANQRHFLWGISILLIVMFIMYPSVRDPFFNKRMSLTSGLHNYFTSPSLWKIEGCSRLRRLIPVLALTAVMPYWHGSVLISMLCMLMVMAFWAKERLAYLAIATVGVLSSFLFSLFFSGGAGNVVSPQFLWGFISPDKSIPGVVGYLFRVIGISLIFIVMIPFMKLSRGRTALFLAAVSLTVFALSVSLTSDVTVNHKYIILSLCFLNIFVADVYITLWSAVRKLFKDSPAVSLLAGILSVFIGFSLFSTGFVEFIGYRNKNIHSVAIDLEAPMIGWIRDNTETADVFLTAPYHMNTFFFSGRKVFYGWPYYTMTAGHDTQSRSAEVSDLFSGCGGDPGSFRDKARKYNLKYAIIDSSLLNDSDYRVDTAFFEENCIEVARFPENGNAIIYKLYD